MKVRDLIEVLSKVDPDLTVCQFTDDGPQEITDVGVFGGDHRIDTSPKLTWGRAEGLYAAIGNPGDFELTASDHDCHRIKDLTERIRSLEADLEARDNAWAVLSGMSNSRIAKLEIKLREVLAALGRPTETLKSSIQAIFDEVSTAKPEGEQR